MVTLTFNQDQDFIINDISPEWQDRIKVSKNGSIYTVSIQIEVDDTSYRYLALMERPQLVLKFSLPYFVEFPIGTSCVFQNQTFTLNDPENLKKQGTRNIEYTMTMGTIEDHLSLYKLRNSVDGRLKWSMCAKPHEFIEEIVKALNERDGDIWYSDTSNIIEATEKTIEFNHIYCDSALSSIAETFETEYEIIDHKNGKFEIALHKVEYFKDSPLPLSYGKGNGFVPGVGRTTESDGSPIKRLYVQGGDRNIDRSTYGELFGYSNNPGDLRLPKSQIIEHEGRQYLSDPEGYYIERYDKVSTAKKEDSLDCSEIYPSYIGHVTELIEVDKKKNFYDIIDSGIPSNLDFNDYLIEGESMTIIFQTGMLSGREFDVKYKHKEQRWELVPMDEDGITMPDETFKPSKANGGDQYAVFGIMLPKEYICDNETKTGASWEMMREAAKYLYEYEEQKFTFTGELQGLYAKRNWLTIGGYIKIGAYIHFSDKQFAEEGVNIRIIGIKDYLNNPYSPTLTISNSIQSATSVSSQLKQIENAELNISETKKSVIQFTKRRFRDAQETISMLEQSLLNNFTESISPIAVQTMSALIGDESLQFEIGRTILRKWTPETGFIKYDNNTKILKCEMSIDGNRRYLRHLTLGVNAITSTEGRDNSEIQSFLTWPMQTYESPVMTDGDQGYYLYAKVNKDNTREEGIFLLSQIPISMEAEEGYYHLLVGILNSEYNGERSFVTLYGFTEILPGRITTERIVSANGESFLDLVTNAFKLGDKLLFNVDGDGQLILKGTMVQSSSGDTEYIGCYRGNYNSTYTYYRGDLVTYTNPNNNITSTYIRIHDMPTTGVPPTNLILWNVYAQGSRPNVAFKSTVFIRTNDTPNRPTGGDYLNPVPDKWSDGIPQGEEILWASTRIFTDDGKSPQQDNWTEPQQMTDTADFDVEFSSVASPSAPTGHPNTNKQWSNTADSTTIWMATSRKNNGVWDDWEISKIKGEKGDDGIAGAFKSTVFCRQNTKPGKPTGGTYESPIPTSTNPKWYDTIPEGTAIIWESVCTFYGAGGNSGWSSPAQVTDTATLDLEFSPDETQPSAPSGNDPTADNRAARERQHWYDPSSENFSGKTMIWRAERKIKNGVYDGAWTITRIYGEKGDKGDKGDTGNYNELRYAVNGYSTSAPTLAKDNDSPTGWTTTLPTVNSGYYLWMTRALKTYEGKLIGNWSDPVRISGENGATGKSPVMVYRGIYKSTETYYGNDNRRDVVRLNGSSNLYYVATITAGEFSNIPPQNHQQSGEKWNNFGANFESIATNLLLAEGANIGDWYIQGGKIVSTLENDSKITLDAKNKTITVDALNGSSEHQAESLGNSIVTLNATRGIVESRDKNNNVSYLSPAGIFANRAATQCVSAVTGADQRAAICALGNGGLNKSEWFMGSDTNLICGVYGKANNTGTAPYFGGYFFNLRVNGLILKTKYITESETYLNDEDTVVIGFNRYVNNVFLPAAVREGQTIFVKQWWDGTLRFYPRSGQKIYDDAAENEYYEFDQGYGGMFTFIKASINGVATEAWMVNRWRY